MMFIELFVPRNTFSEEELRRLGRRLTARELLSPKDNAESGTQQGPERADPGVMEFLETITHVVVHEPSTWITGGEPIGPDAPPHYLARVWVPGPWRKEMSEHLITGIARTLTEFDGERGRTGPEARTEVHVIGVPEGGYGTQGRVVKESDLLSMINEASRAESAASPGQAVDPVCGATITLDENAITLEYDGKTHAFCCAGCRRHFVKSQETGTS